MRRVLINYADPACGTCRKKCRKCDRKRPICDRCRTKGLHCEGYPPRFQFQETLIISAGQRSQEAPPDVADTSPPQVVEEGPLTELLDASDTTALDFALQQTVLDPSVLALTSPLSSATPNLSPPIESFDGRVTGNSDLENDILTNQHIIDYCKTSLISPKHCLTCFSRSYSQRTFRNPCPRLGQPFQTIHSSACLPEPRNSPCFARVVSMPHAQHW